MKTLRPTLAAAALLWMVPACAAITDPHVSGDCLAAVQVDGVVYVFVEQFEGAERFPSGDLYATVARERQCQDVLVDGESAPEPFVDGDSNFLEAGTRLFEVHGYPPTERLVAEVDDGWILVAVDHPARRFVEDGVEVMLSLSAGAIIAPGTVTARLSYAAVGDTAVTVTSSYGCPAFTGVFDAAGDRVSFPATDYYCTAAGTTWTVHPVQPLTTEWPLEIGPDATPLEPGTYRFVAKLNTHDREMELEFEVQ